ncbi:MAG: class I SAM-dependent methyltransferase [Chloroflexi bacterium]|nr:class I SAM-dependent methyltransferase [Chloroflexota bacterium]
MKNSIKRTPFLGNFILTLYSKLIKSFPGSKNYWEKRYASGGNSGDGSYDKLAAFKAEIINAFVIDNKIFSVIELGCGDGNQLQLANYQKYIGLDVSETAISICRRKFAHDPTKSFNLMQKYAGDIAELSLSLDVIFHLVEDEVFNQYMRTLFSAANRYVIIYSSNTDNGRKYHNSNHIKHRKFTNWVEENAHNWILKDYIPNRYPYTGDSKTGSFSDFYFYERI